MPAFAGPSYPRNVATRTPRARAPRDDAPTEPVAAANGARHERQGDRARAGGRAPRSRWRARRDPRPARRRGRGDGTPARGGRGDGLSARPRDRAPPIRARRRHQERAEPGVRPLDPSADRHRHVRQRRRPTGSRAHRRLPRGSRVRPRARPGQGRRGHGHPLDGGGSDRVGGRGLRRARRVQHAALGLQCVAARPRPGAGRPRRGGDGQCPTDRGPRPLALRAGPACRGGALAARDRCPDQRRRRPAGRAPASGRRGGASARCRGCPHRPRRPEARARSDRRTHRATVGSTREEWPDDPDETIDEGVSGQAVVDRPGGLDRRLRQRHRVPSRQLGDDYVVRDRDPLRHGRAARRRGRAVRCPDDLHEAPGRLGRGGRGAARRDRRPGGDHHHDDPTDRGARPVARGARPARRRPSRRCARSPPGSRSCATRRRSSGRRQAGRPAGPARTA